MSPAWEHLLKKDMKERLEAAIKERFGENMILFITVEDHGSDTPAGMDARLKSEAQKKAEQSIRDDPVVKSFMETFDAKLDNIHYSKNREDI